MVKPPTKYPHTSNSRSPTTLKSKDKSKDNSKGNKKAHKHAQTEEAHTIEVANPEGVSEMVLNMLRRTMCAK